ncbi:hypothetical protein BT93_K0020 [Corymbia citriodora subsp. variegata]|nr:hypothetical protein BT93_K0020 [Corymbia citriodora subsp. variegata]
MAKKRISDAKPQSAEVESMPIDHIAKYSQQQRRGPPPKRRSDFSFFFSSSSSNSATSSSPPSSMSSSDYLPRFSNCKDGLSNAAAVSSDEAKDTGRQSLGFTPVKCCKSWMLVAPNKLEGTESSDVCMTPVSVVLERTDYEVLSPAEGAIAQSCSFISFYRKSCSQWTMHMLHSPFSYMSLHLDDSNYQSILHKVPN